MSTLFSIAELILFNLAFYSRVFLSNLLQCFITETSTQYYTLKLLSFFFIFYLYIRLVDTLYFTGLIIDYFSWTLSLVFFGNILLSVLMLQIKDLRVGWWKEPCIRLTQENSIKNSVQDCLSYISNYMVHTSYCAPSPKLPYVSLKVNMHCALLWT